MAIGTGSERLSIRPRNAYRAPSESAARQPPQPMLKSAFQYAHFEGGVDALAAASFFPAALPHFSLLWPGGLGEE